MNSPREIVRTLTPAEISRAVGVHEGRVRQAASEDAFPASWFPAIRALCVEKNLTLSEDLFRWKSAITRTDSTPPLSPRESDVKGG